MRLSRVRVINFRCIKDETLDCENLTILVGPNGSGKSSFLRAIDLFYLPNAKYSEEDFYNRNTSEPIVIQLTFSELTEEEKKSFASHIDGETLTVEKELTWPPGKGSQKYFGSTLRNPDFQRVRAADRVIDKREAYRDLVNSGKFPDLPHLSGNASKEQIENALLNWEKDHPRALQRIRDDGQFFGFKEVGQARLERFTRFLFIPAVRDASEDATEGRGTVISELMDLVVRSTLAQREDLRQLREDVQRRYKEIIDPLRLSELRKLADEMTKTINAFAPGAQIQLNWLSIGDVEIPMPKADVKVVEDGYPTAVERAGHGLQRAFILTALQHLALVQARERAEEAAQESVLNPPSRSASLEENSSMLVLANLILGIEEPELYQHPSRQRHLSKVLSRLANGGIAGVAQNVQVIYTTHSPLFVDLQKFNQIRLLRKEMVGDDKPKQTKVFRAIMDQVVREMERADGVNEGAYTHESLLPRLHTIMTPWTNEGFFADVIVLVEGEVDRAAIIGVAKAMDYDFESMDIAVIPCMGKHNLLKAAAIFRSLQIPIYVIWDSDQEKKDSKPEDNHRLLRFFGVTIENYPARVTEKFACFRVDMDTTLKEEISPDVYDSLLKKFKNEYGYGRDEHARKNPLVVQMIIQEALEKGRKAVTLEQIVKKIIGLKNNGK